MPSSPVNPAVSVVIPTHNRARHLERTLHCVFDQRNIELEVIVIDDGSSDGTARMLEAIGDPRLTTLRNVSALGVSAARNRGIAAARGTWIAFLDDDDLWAPDKLASQLEAAQRDARAWCFTGCVNVTEHMELLSGAPPPSTESVRRSLARHNTVPAGASNVLVTRALLARVGGFEPRLKHTSDWDLWMRLAHDGAPAMVNAPKVAYCVHPNNASCDAHALRDEIALLERRHAQLGFATRFDRAVVHRWAAWNFLRVGQRSDALAAYARAIAQGDLRSLGRAFVVCVPGLWQLLQAHENVDPDWKAQAESWLEPLRARWLDGAQGAGSLG